MTSKFSSYALILSLLLVTTSDSKAFISDPARALTIPKWGISVEPSGTLISLATWDLPVPDDLPITSCYGPRKLLHRYKEFHKGIDFGVPSSTPIYAVADGKAVWKGTEKCSGRTLVLEHVLSNGRTVLSIYRHLRAYKVKVGQTLEQGDLIALSGASGKKLLRTQSLANRGCISGPHLHIEFKIVNDGISFKKLEWILRKNHGHLFEFVHEANPMQFIPQLKDRCAAGKKSA